MASRDDDREATAKETAKAAREQEKAKDEARETEVARVKQARVEVRESNEAMHQSEEIARRSQAQPPEQAKKAEDK